MPYVVAEPCIGCTFTDCVEVCPVDCFYEGPNVLVIHPEECIDCNACVPACPVEAIYPEDELPEAWVHYAEWNAYLAPRWKALGHNLTEKRPDSPSASNLSCADQPRSEADILTWGEDSQDS
ncbi:MAG: ferredoxin family protein [Bacteroidota bacterium]